MTGRPRIGFAGTPELAVPALERLAAVAAVPWVLTQPDRPAGRGRRLTPSAVKIAAERLGLPVQQPRSLHDPGVLQTLEPAPELIVVIAYGLLLPRWLLDWPRLGCVNLHASLLPRWRGAAPIQYAILAGDRETGVSLMRMEAGLDSGPVYAQRSLPIAPDETAASLHDRLAPLAADLLADALPALLRGELRAIPQDPAHVTYAPKLSKDDARLDWSRPAAELERRVRAFDPWPVAEGVLESGQRLRIWRASVVASRVSDPPGTIVAAGRDGIDVATGADLLRLEQVQPPGGRRMAAGAYVAAHPLAGSSFAP